MEGDLEKSRKLLMSKGFISKSNFDGDEEFKKMVIDYLLVYSYFEITFHCRRVTIQLSLN